MEIEEEYVCIKRAPYVQEMKAGYRMNLSPSQEKLPFARQKDLTPSLLRARLTRSQCGLVSSQESLDFD